MKMIALDPGIDVTGWASFRSRGPPNTPNTLNEALRRLTGAGELTTTTSDPDHQRLFDLGLQVRNLVSGYGPDIVVVEVPAFIGDYGGRGERRAAVNRLYMALGAILGRLGGVEVVGRPAIRTPKETRHELLHTAARASGLELPYGPRGGAREDTWDAIWVGCEALLDAGSRAVSDGTRSLWLRGE